MSKDYYNHSEGKTDTLLAMEKEIITQVAEKKLTIRQTPAWYISDSQQRFCVEVYIIQEDIIYLRETGIVNSKDWKKIQTTLQNILSSQKSPSLILEINLLKQEINKYQKRLIQLEKHLSPYCQHLYLLFSKPILAIDPTLLPSNNNFTLVSSLPEALAQCIKQEILLPENKAQKSVEIQKLENASREDLLGMIKNLQEENQQLKEVYELRMAELIATLENLTIEKESANQSLLNTDKHSSTNDIVHATNPHVFNNFTDEQLNNTLFVSIETLHQLKESEQHFRLLSENAQDLTFMLQPDGKITYISPSVNQHLGYQIDEIINTSYFTLVHPDDITQCSTAFDLTQKQQWEFRVRKKDGQFIWMEVNSKTIINSAGQQQVFISSRNITQVKEIIERLTESQEQLRSTFSSIDDDVYVFDKKDCLIASNVKPNKISFINVCSEPCYGRSFKDIFSETLSDQLKAALLNVAETLEVQQFEYCLYDQLVTLYFKVSVSYRKDSLGKYAGFTMIARDITEEKIADRKIIESEKRYRSVVENVREVIFQTDGQGHWSFLNPAWKEISGYDLFDSLDRPLIDFVHPDDQDKVHQMFQKVIQGKKDIAQGEVRFINRHHDIFWADMFIKAYLDESGKLKGTSGTLDDITKRKQAEVTLRQSNLLLASINKNIKEALIRVNYQDGLVYFNQAFNDMFGYHSSEEIQKLPLDALFAQQNDLKFYTKILRNQKAFTNKTILFRRKNGTTFWGLSSFILIKDEAGQEFYDGAIRDITDRKEAEKKLKEKNQELIKTNEELDRFVYSASHDLRAPLASTLGLINISRISPEEKDRAHYLDLMEQSLNRMDKIIQDLTDYARNARLEIETEVIDFESLLKDILQRLKYLKKIDEVTIKTNIKRTDIFYTDKIRLYIILINLISNAIKYQKYDQTHPSIHINITIDTKKAVIEVTDNGIGIDKSHTDKIFTMFFQVSRDSIGSGLGLYIAKETVNKLTGSITVNSVVSKGSTFTVVLPNAKNYQYDKA